MRACLAALLLLIVPACSKPADEAAKSKSVADAKGFQATQDIVQLRRECLQYQAVKGELPRDWDELGRSKNDPWGNEYVLVVDGDFVDIYSAGPDGKYDTPDDIRAPE
jgi:hypothetical protein